MEKLKAGLCGLALVVLSGCVTQKYNDSDKPVVERDFTAEQKALTRITLGLGYLNLGNTGQAKLNFERAKQFAPRLVDVHTAFAHYYEQVGELALAEESFEYALSIEPDNADALNNYGVFLCRQKKVQQAEAQWLKAIAVPTYLKVAESYQNIATCQLGDDRFEEAEASLKKALSHSPNSTSTLYQIAQLHYAKRDFTSSKIAIAQYERATRKFQPEVLALAYKVQSKLRNNAGAKNYASMLLKMFPKSSQTKSLLANQLAEIPADELAKRYRNANLVKVSHAGAKKEGNKKVIRFSPKKQPNVDAATTTQITKADKPVTAQTPTASGKDKESTQPSNPVQTAAANTEVEIAESVVAEQTEAEQKLTKQSQDVIAKETSQVAKKSDKVSSDVKVNKTADGIKMLSLPVHIIERGDSLYSISKKYNIKIKALKKWNKIRNVGSIRVGQLIYLTNPNLVAKQQ